MVSDFCGSVMVSQHLNGTADASGTYPAGNNTLVWTAVDAAGNVTVAQQEIAVLIPLGSSCSTLRFVMGDCGNSGSVGLGDAITLLSFLFQGADAPHCLDACDLDQSGQLAIGDVIALLSCLFNNCPFGLLNLCEPDPVADGLSCEASSCP